MRARVRGAVVLLLVAAPVAAQQQRTGYEAGPYWQALSPEAKQAMAHGYILGYAIQAQHAGNWVNNSGLCPKVPGDLTIVVGDRTLRPLVASECGRVLWDRSYDYATVSPAAMVAATDALYAEAPGNLKVTVGRALEIAGQRLRGLWTLEDERRLVTWREEAK
jgi:hypothetical protein